MARLRGRGLPSPEQLQEVVETFVRQDPLTLDEDAMIYLMGFSKGLRLQQTQEALNALERVWTEAPKGPRADRALLHAALILGFALDRRPQAHAYLDRLDKGFPNSSLLGATALTRAFFYLADSQAKPALEAVSNIAPEDSRSQEGALLGAILAGYYQGDAKRALYFLNHLEGTRGPYLQLSRYHRALLNLVRIQDYQTARANLEEITPDDFLPKSWVDSLRSSLDRILQAPRPIERDLRLARFFERHGHYPRARYEYERLLKQDPDGPIGARVRLRLAALEQDDRGRFGPEVPTLERVVTSGFLGPALQAEARWRLARARLKLGVKPSRIFRDQEAGQDAFSDAALRGLLLNSESTDPERLQILYDLSQEMDTADNARPRVLGTLARGLRNAGAWEQALRIYQELLPDAPGTAPQIHRLMNQMRVEALSPDGTEPLTPSRRLRLALFRLRLGEIEKSEALLEGARQEPGQEVLDSARAAAYLARLLVKRGGRPERIREVLDDALARPELPERDRFVLLELRARRLQEEEPEEAHRLLTKLVRDGYGIRRLLPELVQETWDREGALTALGEFRYLVGKISPDARMSALVASLYEETEQPRRARDARVRLTEAWPKSPEAKQARISLATAAARSLQRELENGPSLRRKFEAIETFLQEVPKEFRPPHRLVLDSFARSYGKYLSPAQHLRLGKIYLEEFDDPKGALPHLRAGTQQTGEHQDDAWLALARAQVGLGDIRGAYGTYQEATASPSLRARAYHAQAQLQELQFHEPEEAFQRELLALKAAPPEELLLEISRGLVRTGKACGANPKKLTRTLDMARKQLAGSDAEGEVRKLLAQALEDSQQRLRAGREWVQAGMHLAPRVEAAPATLRGLELLLRQGRFQEVQKGATAFLTKYPQMEGAEEIRALLRKASARTQVTTLTRSLNWADPESPQNRTRLWRVAQLMVNPLEDYPGATTRLQEVIQLFPGSSEATQAQALLRKLPILESSARGASLKKSQQTTPSLLPEPQTRGEDRLAAARFVEYRLEDRARAAESYRSLFEEDQGLVGLYAGIALLRILTLEATNLEAAWQIVGTLRARPLPASLQGRFRGRLSALASREEWGRLENQARQHPGPEGDAILARLVGLAAASYQDGPLAMAMLRRIKNPQKKLAAALEAADSLDSTASPAPEATTSLDFLHLAIQIAPNARLRAQALIARARHWEDTPSPSRALPDYLKATQLAPETKVGEEAMYRYAQLLLALDQDQEKALSILNRLIEGFPSGDRYQVASTRASDLSRQLQARKLDDRAAREGPHDPPLYFHTGRLLAEKYKALPESLENYRTYLRVGAKPKLLIQAHLEAAEVLARMDKPREALLMLERLERQSYPDLDRAEVLLRRAKLEEFDLANLDHAEKLYKSLLKQYPKGDASEEASQGLKRLEALRAGDEEEDLGRSEKGPTEALRAIREEYLTGRRKNYRAAAEALRAAIDRSRKKEEKAALALELGQLEDQHRKRFAEAAEAYELYLSWSQSGKTQANTLLRLGKIYAQKLRRFARANKVYERFLARYHSHPRRVPTMVAHGKVLEKLDRVQEALQIYQIVVDSFPRSGHDEIALERLAYLKRSYFAAFQGAVDAYRELIARFPFSKLADDAQYSIGRIYEIELGDLSRAKTEYEVLIQRYPTSNYYAKAQAGLARIARR
jgi:tetratricopeptide (TPR) repeat protein